MVAAFFFTVAVLFTIISWSISSQLNRTREQEAGKDYVRGAQRVLPILCYVVFISFGLSLAVLIVQLL